MTYHFTPSNVDYSVFSPGGVLYSLPGHPAFPVRLASEIFQVSASYLSSAGHSAPYQLYDPCCGGAYHLTILGFIHLGAFRSIFASDINPDAVSLAARNLSLLTPAGLEQRRAQIEQLLNQYGKASHREALRHARMLADLLDENPQPPVLNAFQANAFETGEILRQLNGMQPDLVITDIPYGNQSAWAEAISSPESNPPTWRMLEALHQVLSPQSVVSVASDKSQKIAHPGFRQLRRMKIGHRQIVFLSRI